MREMSAAQVRVAVELKKDAYPKKILITRQVDRTMAIDRFQYNVPALVNGPA